MRQAKSVNNLEKELAALHQRQFCILVGNGLTAIYLALLSQGFSKKRIAIPNNVCMNVLLPIYFSNNFPVFVDIEKETLGLDLSMATGIEFDCMIAVHAYGNVCNVEKIDNFCKNNQIFLIEDVAVAQGKKINGRPLGSFGKVSILSFGSGKIINIRHGGALLTDDQSIYEKVSTLLEEIPDFSPGNEKRLEKISRKHTNLYNIDCGKTLPKFASKFKEHCLKNMVCFLSKFSNLFVNELEKQLKNLPIFLKMRDENSRFLLNRLCKNDKISILEAKFGSAYWRFNIFMEERRDELLRHLLAKNFRVSSWYHSIDLLFEGRINHETPLSNWVGDKIINIWVNEEIDENYLESISCEILSFL